MLLENLTYIINKCLNGYSITEQWKEVYISSIQKKGNKHYCNNYRDIEDFMKGDRTDNVLVSNKL